MTNKEKADEISENYSTSRYLPNDKEIAAYDAAMQMAEWKDDKFYMILACIKYSLEKSKVDGVDEFVNNLKKEWEE